jgi:type II secretion system protein C
MAAIKIELNTVRNLLNAMAGVCRNPSALLSILGFAVGGYGLGSWIASDEQPSFPASPVVSGRFDSTGPVAVNSLVVVSAHSGAARAGTFQQSRPIIDLELTGLVITAPASIAIISKRGEKQGIYRIGDRVGSDVKVEDILRDGVVLTMEDKQQWLPLFTKASRAASLIGDGKLASGSAEAETPQSASSTSRGRRLVFSPEVRRQGAMVFDPAGGFRIKKLKSDSLYARMGLRNGDVLRSADGQSMDSPEQLMRLYQQRIQDQQGEIEVLRDGQPQTLKFGGALNATEPGLAYFSPVRAEEMTF